jgi:predicted nucleic acid-binding protein
MQVVVDTTAIIAVITNEATKGRLIQLTTGAELVAPASLPWEVGNAFSAMFKQRRITKDQALAAIDQFRTIPILLIDVPIGAAVTASADLGIYAYDAYMICCARQTGAPLVSLDRRLNAVCEQLGITVLKVQP